MVLECDDTTATQLLDQELQFVSEHFDQIVSQLSILPDDSELLTQGIKLGAHTRDAKSCLTDIRDRYISGDLLDSYVHRRLVADSLTA